MPAAVFVAVRYWKEACIAALAFHAWLLVLSRSVRLHGLYAPTLLGWAFLTLFLGFRAATGGDLVSGLYAFRVYLEPLVGGVAMAVILVRLGWQRLLPQLLALASFPILALAIYQAVLPFSDFNTAIRQTAANAFGELPNAFSVSVVNRLRPFSTFSDPNDFGLFAAVLFLASFAPNSSTPTWQRIRRVAKWGAVAMLALSFSRSATLALIVGICALGLTAVFSAAPERLRSNWTSIWLALLVAGSLAAAAVVWRKNIPQVAHIVNTMSQSDPSSRGHVRSLMAGTWELIDHPAGLGLGVVGPRAGLYGRAGKVYHVESSYLQLGLEAGVVGLLIYALSWVTMFGGLLTDLGLHLGPERGQWARVGLVILCAQGIAFAFLPTIVSLQTGAIVWCFLGLAIVLPMARASHLGG